jgi:hypothetical protein
MAAKLGQIKKCAENFIFNIKFCNLATDFNKQNGKTGN